MLAYTGPLVRFHQTSAIASVYEVAILKQVIYIKPGASLVLVWWILISKNLWFGRTTTRLWLEISLISNTASYLIQFSNYLQWGCSKQQLDLGVALKKSRPCRTTMPQNLVLPSSLPSKLVLTKLFWKEE